MGEKYPGMDTSQGNHGTGDLCVPCVSSAHGYTDFHCKQRNRHCDYRCDRDLSAGAAQSAGADRREKDRLFTASDRYEPCDGAVQ